MFKLSSFRTHFLRSKFLPIATPVPVAMLVVKTSCPINFNFGVNMIEHYIKILIQVNDKINDADNIYLLIVTCPFRSNAGISCSAGSDRTVVDDR